MTVSTNSAMAQPGIPSEPQGRRVSTPVRTGQAPVKKYNRQLRDLIVTGRATPSFIVSHEVGLDEAVDAYDKFDRRVDGYTKVLLKP